MKSDLPLFYYQPNQCSFLEKSISLNNKIFKNIFVLTELEYPQFEKIYKHASTNQEPFEKLCFIRFFIMLDYIRENKIDKFIYCDTDAIFLKYLNFESILENELSVLCKPLEQSVFEDVVSAHFSIWTREGLESFCDFVINTYSSNLNILKPKWDWHQSEKMAGGICDMTLLYNWYNGKKSLLSYYEGGTFDRGIGHSQNYLKDEFLMNEGIKKINITDNGFYAFNKKGEEIELYGIHFQGVNKNIIFSL